jgi:hypothetical protein
VTLIALAIVAVGGCGVGGRAPEPPAPSRSLVPDTIGVVATVGGTDCHQTVTLDTGWTIEIVGASPQCAGESATPVLFFDAGGIFGNLRSLLSFDAGKAPLALSGMDGSTRWVGLVGQINSPGCFKVRFSQPNTGAWLEGSEVHLTSGVLLELAPEFKKPSYPSDAFPLRRDDELCLNSQGRGSSVSVWMPY